MNPNFKCMYISFDPVNSPLESTLKTHLLFSTAVFILAKEQEERVGRWGGGEGEKNKSMSHQREVVK